MATIRLRDFQEERFIFSREHAMDKSYLDGSTLCLPEVCGYGRVCWILKSPIAHQKVDVTLTFSVVRAFGVEVVPMSRGDAQDSHDYITVTNEIVPAGSQERCFQ